MNLSFIFLTSLSLLVFFAAPSRADPTHAFAFRDVTTEAGLLPDVGGIRAHGAAWGDADGDGFPDLFVGVFNNQGSKPSMLFRNTAGRFKLDEQPLIARPSCVSGAAFIDLANTGRLDLFISNNAHSQEGERSVPSVLLRNEGDTKFVDVSKESGACPAGFKGRTIAAADFDGDGLLDLLACDFYYQRVADKGIALYRNLGGHRFDDITVAAGLPRGASIAGVAAADLNGDTWPDLFLVSADGNNRLMLNNGRGSFYEAPGTRDTFTWKLTDNRNVLAGVSIADINRDGWPDIVVGHHFKQPWNEPVYVRLYLGKGTQDGQLAFDDATAKAGITPLEMKAPHVEIQDFDNDGWPDLFLSVAKLDSGKVYPVIYKNGGLVGGVPVLRQDAWGVNDFPNADDRRGGEGRGSDRFYNKMLTAGKITYSAAAPTADFDRDGKLDIFFSNWWIDAPSRLLRNETAGGNWLEVAVEGSGKLNRMGVGCRVNLYSSGKRGDPSALLGSREIAVGYGWCSGHEAVVHFGLGTTERVDIEIVRPHNGGVIHRNNIAGNQRLVIKP